MTAKYLATIIIKYILISFSCSSRMKLIHDHGIITDADPSVSLIVLNERVVSIFLCKFF
jgi:hypothetical protein